MAYTVKKLARLSGVSVRTLHFYDEIGLLTPAYYGDNQYRYYEEEQLFLLQQILFYRELGFPLNEIQRILSSDDFDKIEALNAHKKLLEKNMDQTAKLIQTIDKTIAHFKSKTKMRDEELYYGFSPEKQDVYEQYLINSGQVSQQIIDKSKQKSKHWKKEDWDKFRLESDSLSKQFVEAIENGLGPSSSEVQGLVKQHYQMIKIFWTPSKDSYIGLSQLYCEHPDFHKFYDAYHPKLLEFLSQAMKTYAERELQ